MKLGGGGLYLNHCLSMCPGFVQKTSCELLNHFVTKLGMVVLYHEPECRVNKMACYEV